MINDIQASSQDDPTSSGGDFDASATNTNPLSGAPTNPSGQSSAGQNGVEDPGHLLLAPQTKSQYVSTTHFAMISEEVWRNCS